jgi:hypothetical protein
VNKWWSSHHNSTNHLREVERTGSTKVSASELKFFQEKVPTKFKLLKATSKTEILKSYSLTLSPVEKDSTSKSLIIGLVELTMQSSLISGGILSSTSKLKIDFTVRDRKMQSQFIFSRPSTRSINSLLRSSK